MSIECKRGPCPVPEQCKEWGYCIEGQTSEPVEWDSKHNVPMDQATPYYQDSTLILPDKKTVLEQL